MNSNCIRQIFTEINKINIRLNTIENSNEKIDVDSLIMTEKILILSEINSLKIKINEINEKLKDIDKKIIDKL